MPSQNRFFYDFSSSQLYHEVTDVWRELTDQKYQFIMTNDAFVCRVDERHRSKYGRMNMNDDVFMKFPWMRNEIYGNFSRLWL